MRSLLLLLAGLWASGSQVACANTLTDAAPDGEGMDPATQAHAGASAEMPEPMFGAPTLSDDELAEARGGFMLPSGAQVDFGAVITTSVDGATLLQTQLHMNADGLSSAVSAAPGVTVTINGGPAPTAGGRAADTTASVQLPDLLVQQTVGQRISSIIVNTGDNRTIDTQVMVNLRLDGVQPLSLGSAGYRIQSMTLDAAMLRIR
jgi:hypothetical protein